MSGSELGATTAEPGAGMVSVPRAELAAWARRLEGFAELLRDLSTVDGAPLHSAGEVAHSLATRMHMLTTMTRPDVNDTIKAALAELCSYASHRVDSRIDRFEKALADHNRLGGCIYGDDCRAYTEAREALTGASDREA